MAQPISKKTIGIAVVASLIVIGAAGLIWQDPSLFSSVSAPKVIPDPRTGKIPVSFRLGTTNGWELDVRADGSGELAHDSAATQVAIIPPGTYDVPALRKAVEAAVSATPQEGLPPGGESKIAYIYFGGATGMSPAHFISDLGLANKMLEKAVEVAQTTDPQSFEKLQKKKPVMLPIPPPEGAPKAA